ncbi:ribosome silencing factor [Bacillus sp. 2205SS5-2]|uniref:ribosome silencing factor n=1 Tax=Bacillus sp. 2205SS5-2 TaxID=3109031 RepID=UPI003006CE22
MKKNELLQVVYEAIDDKRGEDIVALNMDGISIIADYFVICHGNSDKQVQAMAREVKQRADEMGIFVKRMEGFDEGSWILVDLGDVVAHIFHKDERNYYHLERLWGDAPLVDLASKSSS